jgi:hypothetical protein
MPSLLLFFKANSNSLLFIDVILGDVACQTAHWKEHKRLCIKGSSAKCDKNGVPKKGKKTARDDIQKHGLAKLQQDMLVDRSNQFYAGVDGSFEVRAMSTKQVLELSDLKNCQQYEVEWFNGREGASDNIRGHAEVLFLSAASLALEMHALTMGKADPHFKYLEGNFLYLEGEPHLFWSMMIHRKQSGGGACLPFEAKTDQKWEETWCIQELEKMVSPMMANGLTPEKAGPLKMQSRSLAMVEFMQQRNNDNLFGVQLDELYIPTEESLLPKWWAGGNALWTSLLQRADAAGRVPCMFYCTPSGCVAGEAACVGHHDEEFKDKVCRIKRHRPNY